MSQATAAFLRAVDAQRAGDLEGAFTLYREALTEEPDFAGALFNLAALMKQQGLLQEAERLYRRVLALTPEDPEAHSNFGNLLQAMGDRTAAEQHYREALALNPSLAEARINLAYLYSCEERLEEAEQALRMALSQRPDLTEAHINLAIVLRETGRGAEARAALEAALAQEPDNPSAQLNMAVLTLGDGDYKESEAWARKLLAHFPQSPSALYQLGTALSKQERYGEAVAALTQAAALRADHPETWQELGFAQAMLESFEEAEQALQKAERLAAQDPATQFHFGNLYLSWKKARLALPYYERAMAAAPDVFEIAHGLAVALHEVAENERALQILEEVLERNPDFLEALNTRGNCLTALGRHAEACREYERAIAIQPEFAVGYYNLGNALWHRNLLEEAKEAFQRCLELSPRMASGHSGLGLLNQQIGRHEDAIACFDAALAARPDFGDALNNKAISLQSLGRYREAVDCYYRMIELDPSRSAAYFNLGGMLQLLERWDESAVVFKQGLSVEPDCAIIYPYLVHSLLQQCNWTNLDAYLATVRQHTERELAAGTRVSITPFALQSLPGEFSMALRQQVAEATSKRNERSVSSLKRQLAFNFVRGPRRKRLKIGYVSPDFRFHSVAVSFRGILESHNRDDFEFYAYSLHRGRTDHMQLYFRHAFDHYTDMGTMPTQEAVEKIHADGIDILVDLAGHTRGTRHDLFALRPAPIQAHYLGYSATIGARFLDYLITDRRQVPPEQRAFFTETLVYLPDVFMAGRRAAIDPQPTSRADEGLPEDGIVFANFNNHYKFDPRTFSIWMRLLRLVPGSVLWVVRNTPRAASNLRLEAARRGVDPDRLVFSGLVPHEKHLARLRAHADLALDNFWHGGGITTIDALWAGVPVLTVAGETPQSRNGASLLHAAGMPELVCPNLESFERLALSLAQDPRRLAAVKAKLMENRERCALFDMARLTRHLEQAYRLMWENYADGNPPRLIDVPSLEEACPEHAAAR